MILFMPFAYLEFILIYFFGFFHFLLSHPLFYSAVLVSRIPAVAPNLVLLNWYEKCHIWGKTLLDLTTACAYFIQRIRQPETVKSPANKTRTDTRTFTVK